MANDWENGNAAKKSFSYVGVHDISHCSFSAMTMGGKQDENQQGSSMSIDMAKFVKSTTVSLFKEESDNEFETCTVSMASISQYEQHSSIVTTKLPNDNDGKKSSISMVQEQYGSDFKIFSESSMAYAKIEKQQSSMLTTTFSNDNVDEKTTISQLYKQYKSSHQATHVDFVQSTIITNNFSNQRSKDSHYYEGIPNVGAVSSFASFVVKENFHPSGSAAKSAYGNVQLTADSQSLSASACGVDEPTVSHLVNDSLQASNSEAAGHEDNPKVAGAHPSAMTTTLQPESPTQVAGANYEEGDVASASQNY